MFSTDRQALGHGGFSLIELMVAMAVLAILSALAIPSYGRVRQRFYDATALADVLNAGKALAGMDGPTSFSQTVAGPGPIPSLPGPRVSKGTTLSVSRSVAANGTVTFLAQGSHKSGTGATYFFDNSGKMYATGANL
jgi:prepilin-type N-terminal cleavage/methylation domain-containing protein